MDKYAYFKTITTIISYFGEFCNIKTKKRTWPFFSFYFDKNLTICVGVWYNGVATQVNNTTMERYAIFYPR